MNTNTLVVGLIAFIIGTTTPWLLHSVGMYGGSCGMMSGMSHKMPDGSMMQGQMNKGMAGTMMDMSANLRGKTGAELEKAFIEEMIPHHQGAVDMARILIADPTVDKKYVDFGNAIITAQEGEILQMREWLKSY